jgi:citrate synthase
MFTVIFAMGRMPGWIANWKEVFDNESTLYRPRQVYVGPAQRDYVPMEDRDGPSCLAPRRVDGVLTCD